MKPFFVLLISFLLALSVARLIQHDWNLLFAGNLAMALMLFFTSIGHFAFTKGMTMMLPNFISYKYVWVYLTGVLEIIAGLGLLLPMLRYPFAIALIIFFLLMLPANIYAAVNHIDYEKGTRDGKGPGYLWFRVPLQMLFVGWVWYFGIYLSP